jgi:ABC-type nitrate/sulfonate/bicarbonate transport system substrate-binding protein
MADDNKQHVESRFRFRSFFKSLGLPQNSYGFLFFLVFSSVSIKSFAAEPLVIAVARSPLSLPLYVAQKNGYFEAEGVKIKIEDVIGGKRAMENLVNGSANLATVSEAVAMFNSFKRNDYSIITTFVTSNDDVKMIVSDDSIASRPEQLIGKKIGTITASASHYFLDNFLISQGIDPKKIKLVSLQPEAMALSLRKREVDAVAVWEPYAYEVLQAVKGSKVLPNKGGYVLNFNLIVHNKHKQVKDEELIKLLRALKSAEQYIKNEPLQAQSILRQKLGLNQDFVDWIWPRNNYRLSLDQSLISTMASEARWARQEGHVVSDRTPNFLEYIYTLPLRKVDQNTVGIVE